MRERPFDVSIRDLFNHAVHLGHQKRRWNPKMSRYIYAERNGAHIINLDKTSESLSKALEFIYEIFLEGGNVLFVATRPISKRLVGDMCEELGCFYVNNRWLGGTLSNWFTMLKSIQKLEFLNNLKAENFKGFNKKETLLMERELSKLCLNFNGVKDMKQLPKAVVVMDCDKEKLALKEANAIGVPTVGIVDTNADPELVTYPIYGNDDSRSAIFLYCKLFTQAIKLGQHNRKSKINRERVQIDSAHKIENEVRTEKVEMKAQKIDKKADKTSISADLVKSLHKEIGVGVLNCKKALLDAKGDLKKAKALLMERGLALAAQKTSRIAAEGVVAVKCGSDLGMMIEINCETDFVARNAKFQEFCREISDSAFRDKCADIKILEEKFGDKVSQMTSVFGEKIQLRKALLLRENHIFSYLHNSYPDSADLGKIGVLISVKSDAKREELEELCSNICMHITAFKPIALNYEGLDSKLIEGKKELFKKISEKDGKDKKLLPKIIDGKLKSFYKEVVLMDQAYVMDETKSVSQVLSDFSKKIGKNISIENFHILILGQGIEKKQEDFAEAVKKATDV